MKAQDWIFTVRYCPEGERDFRRHAVVGPARASTVEAALHLAGAPEAVRVEIRTDEVVRKFVEGLLDPDACGYYASCPITSASIWLPITPASSWCVCIGSIQEVIS